MPDPMLKILLVEDYAPDADLIEHELSREGPPFKLIRVDSREGFLLALQTYHPDLILSDYHMPRFDGMSALQHARSLTPETPFIIVTGATNEEIAVECMKAGADDYILKDHLSRLGPSVRAALDKARIRREKDAAESSRRESEERYRSLIDASPDAIICITPDLRVEYCNPQAAHLMGVPTSEELFGRSLLDAIPPEDVDRLHRDVERILRVAIVHNLEYTLLRRGGTSVPVEISASLVHDTKGKPTGLTTIVRDITARKAVERAHRLSEAQFRELAENTDGALCLLSRSGEILYMNPVFARAMGPGPHGGVVRPESMADRVHPDDAERVIRAYRHSIESAEPFDGEFRVTIPDGGTRWIWARSHPVRDDSGAIVRFVGVALDVTARKEQELELRTAKERAEQSDRLKDAFIANISHEVRTPLNVVLGFSQLIEAALQDRITDQERRYFARVRHGSDRLMRTVEMILSISRLQAGDIVLTVVPVDVAALIEERMEELRPITERRGLAFTFENTAGSVTVAADRYCLSQAIGNLLDNALKFTPDGGIAIRLFRDGRMQPVLDVTDSGIGIAADFLPHVFDPYSQEDSGSTRSYEGIGLGLAIVHRYLALHGMRISVRSEKGAGSTFSIHFAATEITGPLPPRTGDDDGRDAGRTADTAAPAAEERTDPPRVLLVEDDEETQEFMRVCLEGRYALACADSAEGALAALRAQPTDLLLLDISIRGGVNGLDLVRRLRRDPVYAALPIIAVTAHAFPEDRARSLDAGCNDFIAKPIRRTLLLDRMRALLDGPPPS